MIRRPPRSTHCISSAASDVYKRQINAEYMGGDVIKKLERWYGVHFEIKDTSLLNFRFTANFKSESITKVLEILKLSSNIGSKIDDTKITLTRLQKQLVFIQGKVLKAVYLIRTQPQINMYEKINYFLQNRRFPSFYGGFVLFPIGYKQYKGSRDFNQCEKCYLEKGIKRN
eukprot:TRINITY_DN35885_c0_g1_i2.p1 TRINITY_DN35885_c0_g1~~TRINITY_DN35885_c0_g1_i2.p1  ORF type:complete len:171 (+),score=32.89 TRINITY_DN35885_c0_g1_i2:89-601(+)